MKKVLFSMAAAILMCTSASAQTDNAKVDNAPQERPQVDQTEMIKERTENTAKQYGLTEEQTKQLLELNTKYADKMPMGFGRRGGGRRGGPRPGFGGGPQGGPQGGFGGGPQGGFGGGQMPQMSEEQRAQMQERMKQMQENMEAYDAELEKIFTPEQFKAYKEDQEKNRARRGGGPRPQ